MVDFMDADFLDDVNSDDRLYTELSRVNNELINAQREVVQRNVRLERAEKALRKAQDDLERQVRERTSELENTLSAFREEVSVHRKTEEKLRELSLSVLRIQDEERRRVARDLHDTVGQTLTALKITLSTLENAVARYPQAADFFTDLNGLADQALREIRTTSYLLHPPLLDEAGFAAAAAWYVDGFNKRSPIRVRLQLPEGIRLPGSVEIVLFRVLQESLTNITKHAGSATVDVLLQVDQTVISLSVRDYGKGISAERLAKMKGSGSDVGVGIAGMRERLKELGGRLEIESDSTGTMLKASVPFPDLV
ncbi:MAG: domain S-box [Candidatus Sulfotelmatobacter sp.]|nr:domain S-box [Candidatus Sulfotelmatobacter sp.]